MPSSSGLHPTGCSCNLCSGPALWNTVFISSLPTLLPPSVSAAPGETQRQAPQVHRSRFHLPHWLSSQRRTADAGTGNDIESLSRSPRQPLVADAILCGQTKSPITLEDLRAFLTSTKGGDRLSDLVALDFLLAFNAYKADFFALLPSQRAPHPYAVIESLSKLGVGRPLSPPPLVPSKDPASPLSFVTPSPNSIALPTRPPVAAVGNLSLSRSRSGSEASDRSVPLNRQPARARAATFDSRVQLDDDDDDTKSASKHGRNASRPRLSTGSTSLPLILDPAAQPLRVELQVIIDRYLSGHSSTLLMNIVSSSAVSLALSETELTTHPSTLEPIAKALTSHLNTYVLPKFFNSAVVNLSSATSRGRLIMALVVLVIALALTVVFITQRQIFPRWSRLALTPFYVASIGYLIGSQTSLCFWLAWRGTREAKQYEEDEKAALAERRFRDSSLSMRDWPDTEIESTLRRALSGKTAVNTYSIYTINALNHQITEKGERFARRWKNVRSMSMSLRKEKDPSFHMVTAPPPDKKERLLRMTGTATSTVPVEDASVRMAQVRIAVKVTIWLVLGTVATMAAVLVIP